MKAFTKQQNKQKIRKRKGVLKVPPLKELRDIRINYLIINLVWKMKTDNMFTP